MMVRTPRLSAEEASSFKPPRSALASLASLKSMVASPLFSILVVWTLSSVPLRSAWVRSALVKSMVALP